MTSPTHSPPHVAHLWLSGHGAPPSDLPRARLRQYHRPATPLRRAFRPRPTPPPEPAASTPLRRSMEPVLRSAPQGATVVLTVWQRPGLDRRPHHPRFDSRRTPGAVSQLQRPQVRCRPPIPPNPRQSVTRGENALTSPNTPTGAKMQVRGLFERASTDPQRPLDSHMLPQLPVVGGGSVVNRG